MGCRCTDAGQLLAECECEGRVETCSSCAGTGLKPAGRVRVRFEPAMTTPCPAHAPHDYRIWLARGALR